MARLIPKKREFAQGLEKSSKLRCSLEGFGNVETWVWNPGWARTSEAGRSLNHPVLCLPKGRLIWSSEVWQGLSEMVTIDGGPTVSGPGRCCKDSPFYRGSK